MRSLIDTDVKTNINHIRPYLGILLVASMALGIILIIRNAAAEFTQTIQTQVNENVTGYLRLSGGKDIRYGDTINFRSSVTAGHDSPLNTYITTVCFQKNVMVFQRSVQQGVGVRLYDQIGGGLEWDGGPASCSAALMYRNVNGKEITVSVVDAVSFEVEGRLF